MRAVKIRLFSAPFCMGFTMKLLQLLRWLQGLSLIQIGSRRARRSRRHAFSGSATCAAEVLEVRALLSAPTVESIGRLMGGTSSTAPATAASGESREQPVHA